MGHMIPLSACLTAPQSTWVGMQPNKPLLFFFLMFFCCTTVRAFEGVQQGD